MMSTHALCLGHKVKGQALGSFDRFHSYSSQLTPIACTMSCNWPAVAMATAAGPN